MHDSAVICREYAPVFLKHNKIENGKKRKRGDTGLSKPDAPPELETHAQARSSLSSSIKAETEKDRMKQEKAAESSLSIEIARNTTVEDVASTQTPQPSNLDKDPDSAPAGTLQSQSNKIPPVSELLRQPPGSPDDKGNYYYLIKPRTTGAEKVLIVLSPTDSLLDCLRNQTVLEFPSIQILPNPPHSLPSGFILVHNWLDKFNKERDGWKRLMDEAGDLGDVEALQENNEEDLPPGLQTISNDADILAMLQQDVLERKGL